MINMIQEDEKCLSYFVILKKDIVLKFTDLISRYRVFLLLDFWANLRDFSFANFERFISR